MTDSAQANGTKTKNETHQHHPHVMICINGDDDDDDDVFIVDETHKSDIDAHQPQQPPTPTILNNGKQLRGIGGHNSGNNKRNRVTMMTVDDDDAIEEQLVSTFKNQSHSLRISASSVAALCGLHPFQNVPQLLFDLVYQSHQGQLLLQKDAQALGLILVDAKTHQQETMISLASSASNETKELIQHVIQVSEGKRKLHSVEEVQSIQRQIQIQAMTAQQQGKITQQQVDSLLESSRCHVSTGFGTCHEEEALDVYEKRIGERVRERNETLMEWNFERNPVVDGGEMEIGVTAVPLGRAQRRQLRRRWEDCVRRGEGNKNGGDDGTSGDSVDIDDDENASNELINGNTGRGEEDAVVSTENLKPFFRIVGAVDGIRDELYVDSSVVEPSKRQVNTGEISFPDNEEGQWSIRPIIVECKHRMKNAIVPPPIYDQIQTSLYCHMYGVEAADLIQVVRRKSKSPKVEVNTQDNSSVECDGDNQSKTKDTAGDIEITVTRVSLNDPIYQHRHHWEATLLPRLASFVDAVYSIRKEDGKRYRLLMALIQSQQIGVCSADGEEEAWKVLWDECQWMRDCDTAFEQKRRWIQNKKISMNDSSLN